MEFLTSILHHPPATALYTLSLHDALPIFQHDLLGFRALSRCGRALVAPVDATENEHRRCVDQLPAGEDRKSTRLNSSHGYISYAVFCLKKKNTSTHAVSEPDDTTGYALCF